MEKITKDILNYLQNKHTKVELKEDFKGNYYSYITDTIYLSKNFENTKIPSAAKKINPKAAELVVVCHECIHSVQGKWMHILNTIFSNLSILLALAYMVAAIFFINSSLWFKIITSLIIIASIVIRLVLELEAINGSINLARNLVQKEMVEQVSKQDIEESVKYIKQYKFFALVQMVVDKIIFLILVLIIT